MNAGETKSLKEAISNLKVTSQLCGEIGGDLMQQLDESITKTITKLEDVLGEKK